MEVLFLGRYSVDVVVHAVAVEFLRGRAALLLVVLVVNLPEGDVTSSYVKFGLCCVVEVVKVAVGAFGLWGEVLRVCARSVKKEPCYRVVYSRLACSVVSVNAGAVAVKLEFCALYALEIFELQSYQLHEFSSFIAFIINLISAFCASVNSFRSLREKLLSVHPSRSAISHNLTFAAFASSLMSMFFIGLPPFIPSRH